MKVLWFTNIPMPQMLGNESWKHSSSGGWMIGLLEHLSKFSNLNLFVSCVAPGLTEKPIPFASNVTFLPIRQGSARRLFAITDRDSDPRYREACIELIAQVRPDVIHVFGTERFYGLLGLEKQQTSPVVISLQGLLHVYVQWRHYFGATTLKDILSMHDLFHLIRWMGPLPTYFQLRRSANRELKILKGNQWFMGRTQWDRAHLLAVNPHAQYFHVSELLRSHFYEGQWDVNGCFRHRIIFTNANSTNRGVEVLLDAVSILKREFPDVKLALAGGVEQLPYGQRLQRKIETIGLKDSVEYLGRLNEKQMTAELEKAHTFVITSFLENSPNSLCEAQLIGLPCVASYTGGIPSLVQEGETGLLFPVGDAALLATRIGQIFRNDELAQRLGNEARKTALIRHDPETVSNTVVSTYATIIDESRTHKLN